MTLGRLSKFGMILGVRIGRGGGSSQSGVRWRGLEGRDGLVNGAWTTDWWDVFPSRISSFPAPSAPALPRAPDSPSLLSALPAPSARRALQTWNTTRTRGECTADGSILRYPSRNTRFRFEIATATVGARCEPLALRCDAGINN